MPHAHRRHGAIRLARREIRQPARHQVVQPQASLPHQRQRGRRDDGFADGGQAKDGIFAHGRARFAVQLAGRAAIHVLATLAHQHHGAHQALLQDGIKQGIETGGQGRGREVGSHGSAFQMIKPPR